MSFERMSYFFKNVYKLLTCIFLILPSSSYTELWKRKSQSRRGSYSHGTRKGCRLGLAGHLRRCVSNTTCWVLEEANSCPANSASSLLQEIGRSQLEIMQNNNHMQKILHNPG